MVTPRRLSWAITLNSTRTSDWLSALVGSSMISTRVSLESARAISTSC